MIRHEHQIRVRYAETDKMGVVYYGRYAEYFEISRAELIRHFGYSYAEMEADGVMMPVTEMRARYLRPARYDDLLTLRSTLYEVPAKRITIETDVLTPQGKLSARGLVTLAFVDMESGQAVSAPERFLQMVAKHWQASNS